MINLNFNLQSTTGIYVGSREVYIAQVKGTLFGPRLIKFGKAEIQLSDQSDEAAQRQAILQAIKRVVRENNVTTRQVFTALPGKDVLIRYFQMPRIPKAEWETAIRFEAKKYIPFKIEELMWDFHVVLPKDKDAKMDITFVAVRIQTAQSYISLLKQAGLNPVVLEPAPFSLLRLFALGNQLAKDKPTAIVDVDYGIADINIVKDKICYLTRDVSLPLEAELIFDNLLNEIRMSLDYYEKLFPAEMINKILLCGEAELKDWDKTLAQDLKLPVEKANPAKALKIHKVSPPLSMSVAIGLGLRGLSKTIAEVNLYHIREVKPKAAVTKEVFKLTAKTRQVIFRAALLSCVGLVTLHLLMYYRIGEQRKELEKVESLRPKIDLPIESLSYLEMEELRTRLENRLSVLNLIIAKRTFRTNQFNELAKIIPPDIWLTKLSFSEGLSRDNNIIRSLTIRGAAYCKDPVEEIGIVTKFVSNLKENKEFSRAFKEIKLDSVGSEELKGKSVKNFVITCVTR